MTHVWLRWLATAVEEVAVATVVAVEVAEVAVVVVAAGREATAPPSVAAVGGREKRKCVEMINSHSSMAYHGA